MYVIAFVYWVTTRVTPTRNFYTVIIVYNMIRGLVPVYRLHIKEEEV